MVDKKLTPERAGRGTLEVETSDDDYVCCVCADEICEGDEMVWEPSPHIAPNVIEPAHPGCSFGNGWEVRRVGR